jgi:hypothetical protein
MLKGLGGWLLRIFIFILGKLFDMASCCLCYDLRQMNLVLRIELGSMVASCGRLEEQD